MRARSLAVTLAALLCAACGPPPIQLVVDLRTNLRPGVEFERIETAIYPGGDSTLDLPTEVAPMRTVEFSADALSGVRAAEFSNVDAGLYFIRVRLLDEGGLEVGVGLSLVRIDATRIVTVIVDRACGGVLCPGNGSPSHIACLGGRCVDPLCPNDPSQCPEAQCFEDEHCVVDGPECVRGACLVGQCVSFADDTLCAGGVCDRETGCGEVPDAGPRDAGPRDAGVDMDAGPRDAGMDAGVDGGPDAGVDAGPDAGVDAGRLPCVQVPNSGTNIGWPELTSSRPTWDALPTGNCSGAPTGQTPYYYETRYCNLEAAPRSITFDIIDHLNEPEIAAPSVWGWLGDTAVGACHFAITGIGSAGTEVTLQTGEYLTIRVGSTQTGATGWTGGSTSP